ncbi:hypothetical protein PLANPX_5921 [Lacipirellula parvula]|uniref:Uncharacterized protein n=1 Tax=Lacipirellula parvula TaxID=2650471 RepID=A0A5K7XR49_9BACT|nr:hypothetical protein PLANPX_5921 [Lacipirellula parvula]
MPYCSGFGQVEATPAAGAVGAAPIARTVRVGPAISHYVASPPSQ